jgi:glycerophosphoryl diester phosphodiesterase
LIRRAHRRGKTIMAWTVNDALAMSNLTSQGVDGLITDYPDLAARVLTERSELNPAERLLLRVAAWSGRAPVYAPQ